jgi:hypothetical protein
LFFDLPNIIDKIEQGDVFSFKKVKKVNLASPECEEEEYDEYEEDEGYKILTKDDLIRKEKETN